MWHGFCCCWYDDASLFSLLYTEVPDPATARCKIEASDKDDEPIYHVLEQPLLCEACLQRNREEQEGTRSKSPPLLFSTGAVCPLDEPVYEKLPNSKGGEGGELFISHV